jgi:signal transduction histidine kinase
VAGLRRERIIGLHRRIEEFAGKLDRPEALTITVNVTGEDRLLQPVAADELERIAVEALLNAARHAAAGQIDVMLDYGIERLTLTVADDGAGIAPDVLAQGGREGHFGFRGMRERAKRVGGRLEIRSTIGAGSTIVAIVPASTAYIQAARPRSWLRTLLGRFGLSQR